jgi:hypothetical protein
MSSRPMFAVNDPEDLAIINSQLSSPLSES